MIVAPPGEPSASTGSPPRVTIVGDMLERGACRRPASWSRRPGWRIEVRQLVVEQEPAAGDDDAAAAGLLDRERVRDDVAARVGDGQVCRRRALLRGRTRPSAQGGAARGLRGGQRGVGDQRRARVRERLREQAAQRDVDEVGIARGTRRGRRRRASTPRGSGAAPDGRPPARPSASRMLSASPTVEPPLDGGPMPQTSRPRQAMWSARATWRRRRLGRRWSSAAGRTFRVAPCATGGCGRCRRCPRRSGPL